jgi:protein SCO1/2
MMSPDDLKKTRALFVSLDPEKDTLDVLKQYTGYFHPNIVGVTDRLEILIELSERYGVQYRREDMPESPLGYVIYHTSDVLVLDTWGQLQQQRIPPSATVEEITAYVKELLPHQ